MRGRPLVLLTLISRLALALPSEAFAHRVHGEAETIPEVIRLGIRHTRYFTDFHSRWFSGAHRLAFCAFPGARASGRFRRSQG
jgi:hypothetical protein